MYSCSNCKSNVSSDQIHCPKCGAKLIWESAENNGSTKEAKRQLVGITIITILGILIYGAIWIASVADSIIFGEIGYFFAYTLLFGGILAIHIMGLIGLIKRKRYAVVLSRIVLVLSGGLIWLIMLWPRLSNPIVHAYLTIATKLEPPSPLPMNHPSPGTLNH